VGKAPGRSRAKIYFETSRTWAASVVFVAPLFALYEVALAADEGVRSGTVPLVHELFHPMSHLGLVAFNLVLLGLLCLAIYRTRAKRRRVEGLYGLMFVEAAAWSLLMLAIGILVMQRLQPGIVPLAALPELPRRILGGIGAGIYEEFLFRFLLLGGMLLVLHRGLGANPVWSVPLAIVASAAAFSYAHHVIGREPYSVPVFLYRGLMGVILGTAFTMRGLGIVVYAHALYNLCVAFFWPR
jgi:membrane protease YdiL (CAAX protease family)